MKCKKVLNYNEVIRTTPFLVQLILKLSRHFTFPFSIFSKFMHKFRG